MIYDFEGNVLPERPEGDYIEKTFSDRMYIFDATVKPLRWFEFRRKRLRRKAEIKINQWGYTYRVQIGKYSCFTSVDPISHPKVMNEIKRMVNENE